MMALAPARAHGIPVNEKLVRDHAAKTLGQAAGFEGLVRMGADIHAMGYALLAMDAQGIPPNISTAAIARRFANAQWPDGHWSVQDGRPPHSYSSFTATALSVRVLALYLPDGMGSERDAKLRRAAEWLSSAEAKSTEDRAFRLLGLHWAGASAAVLRKAANDLLSRQREDGGWTQVEEMERPDAYSTGQALYALVQSGVVPVSAQAFERGISFLLETQKQDGSWHVVSRLHSKAQISPPFFDAGFPNGKDQFISFAGTAWAVMALTEALPPADAPGRPLAVPEAEPKNIEQWMKTVVYGSVDDLKAALDGGLDPNTTTKNGLSILMLAMPDEAKAALLLDRGAKPTDEALEVAAGYHGTESIVRRLLDGGAHANGNALLAAVAAGNSEVAGVLFNSGARLSAEQSGTALSNAVMSDDARMLRLLAQRGVPLNGFDEAGLTPLMVAAIMHRNEIVRELLELGAKPEVTDKNGQTARDHAADIWYMDTKTAELLPKPTAGKPVRLAGAPRR